MIDAFTNFINPFEMYNSEASELCRFVKWIETTVSYICPWKTAQTSAQGIEAARIAEFNLCILHQCRSTFI